MVYREPINQLPQNLGSIWDFFILSFILISDASCPVAIRHGDGELYKRGQMIMQSWMVSILKWRSAVLARQQVSEKEELVL